MTVSNRDSSDNENCTKVNKFLPKPGVILSYDGWKNVHAVRFNSRTWTVLRNFVIKTNHTKNGAINALIEIYVKREIDNENLREENKELRKELAKKKERYR